MSIDKDRLVLDTIKLENGMTVYSKPWDVPFATMSLFVPVGHVNNTGPILPGSAHFLEHLVCRRSERFPNPNDFRKFVTDRGGDIEATTSLQWTEYELWVPTDTFPEVFVAFMDHVYSPLICADFFENEAGVISNERQGRSRWYPAKSRLGHHRDFMWKRNLIATIRQVCGDDADLAQMNVPNLNALHRAYRDTRTHLFIGGSYDLELACREISKIESIESKLESQHGTISWQNRGYHVARCEESDRIIYHMGGIIDTGDIKVSVGNSFLGNLLTNPVNGPLFEWLRTNLGRSYGMGFGHTRTPLAVSEWELLILLSNEQQADDVRAQLHEKIQDAIADENLIAKELKRRLSQRVFSYQMIDSVLGEAAHTLHQVGHVITEEDSVRLMTECANPAFLQEIYNKYWTPGVSGEFLATPYRG